MNKLKLLFAVSASLAALTLTRPCLAQQNLLKNGGFEAGLNSWQVTGGKFYAGFESVDCDGDGVKTKCFSVSPDSRSNPFYLSQKVSLTKGRTYWLRASVLGTGSLTATNWSEVYAFIGPQVTWVHQNLTYRNPHTSGKAWMVELSCQFTPAASYTWFNLRFQTGARANLGFKIHVDDIELYETKELPWIQCTTTRNLSPKSIGIRTYGKPGAFYLMWLGTRRLSQGIPLPGMSGLLEMDPTGGMVLIGTGVLKPNGTDDVSLPLTPAIYSTIKAKPLYWMPVQVTSLPTTVTIGKVARWGFL